MADAQVTIRRTAKMWKPSPLPIIACGNAASGKKLLGYQIINSLRDIDGVGHRVAAHGGGGRPKTRRWSRMKR